jgi:hypothetical protein
MGARTPATRACTPVWASQPFTISSSLPPRIPPRAGTRPTEVRRLLPAPRLTSRPRPVLRRGRRRQRAKLRQPPSGSWERPTLSSATATLSARLAVPACSKTRARRLRPRRCGVRLFARWCELGGCINAHATSVDTVTTAFPGARPGGYPAGCIPWRSSRPQITFDLCQFSGFLSPAAAVCSTFAPVAHGHYGLIPMSASQSSADTMRAITQTSAVSNERTEDRVRYYVHGSGGDAGDASAPARAAAAVGVATAGPDFC